MMIFPLITVFVCISAYAIRLDMKENRYFPVVKPIPLIIIIVFLLLNNNNQLSEVSILLILIGLFLGMMGDILLTKDKLFLFGLSSFLLGHVFYVVFFIFISESFNPIFLLFIIIPVLYASQFFQKLPLEKQDMILPVSAYMVVITAMVISSLNMLSTINSTALFFPIGSFLFYISDSILAWHLMISPVKHNSLWVMTLYYAAQFCIGIGAYYHLQM